MKTSITWIKIQTDMFENRKIRRIMAQKDGDSIVLIWVRLLTLAGETNDGGAIYFTPEEPYTSKSLSEVFGKPEALVQKALSIFEKYDMIEISPDGIITVLGWMEYQNADKLDAIREYNREAARRSRERKKVNDKSMTVNDESMTTSNGCQRKEESTKEERNFRIKDNREGETGARAYNIKIPTADEVRRYISDNGFNVKADVFFAYYQARGWKINGEPINDWRPLLMLWNARQNERSNESAQKRKNEGSAVSSFSNDDFYSAF